MNDLSHYPNMNDRPHERPILSMTGNNVLGELVWLWLPIVVIVVALMIR